MFHLDFTAEDTRLIAYDSSTEEGTMDVLLIDNISGKQHRMINVQFCDLEKLVSGMICCHGNIPAASYPQLEQLLEDCPKECRPIP